VYVATPSKRTFALQRLHVSFCLEDKIYFFPFSERNTTIKYCKSLICLLMICRDEDWEDNDGALNTISMTHPRIPIEHPNRLVVNDSDCHPLQPGIWLALLYRIYQVCFCLAEMSILDCVNLLGF
jgi:hypothetical protein